MRSVVASVPGKLILMGEHAAVYGRPAVVASVGLRARVELSPGGSGIELELPDLGYREMVTRDGAVDTALEAGATWKRFAGEPLPERFAELRSADPGRLARIAVGETLADLHLEGAPSFRLRITSEIPIGAGFGSSAALSVGIVAALLAGFEGRADARRVDRLALEVERRQHGLPSGVDHGTVLRGGVVWATRDERGDLKLEDLVLGNDLLSLLAVFHTGTPSETTGTVVAAVRNLRERDVEAFDERLKRMARDVGDLRRVLVAPQADPVAAADLMRDYQRCLEEIGVVPDPVAETVRAVERAGAAAKVSGAGSLTGDAAGCLLLLAPRTTGHIPELEKYDPYPIELGAPGLELEIHR